MRVRQRDGTVLRQLRTLYNLGTIRDLTDGQLLERFATDADEVAELAFSALVERHQTMVWRVCLAIVRDEHDAEDAFQGTFLVLVRKARSLWVRDSLGPWLHQVAYRTASCVRLRVIRRRKHEQQCAERLAAPMVALGTARDPDREAAVQEEVNRLPEKLRAPIVLCDLEGRTHQEAARFLGWPIGTVKTRQARGRDRIRQRLVRRGWQLAVAGAVVESLRRSAVAALSDEVSGRIVHAALHQSARLSIGFGLSAHLITLTQGVHRGMSWVRLRFLTIAPLAIGILSGGASVYVCGFQAATSSNEPPAAQRPAVTAAPTAPPGVSTKAAAARATPAPQATLRAQQLATRKAWAVYQIAKLSRELAEIAVEEYVEGIYKQEVEGEIALAGAERKRAEDRIIWSDRMHEKGFISKAQNVADKVSLQQKVFAFEQAQTKKAVLEKYTRDKTIKELQSKVEKAHADEGAKKEAWDLEKAKEIELERRLFPATRPVQD